MSHGSGTIPSSLDRSRWDHRNIQRIADLPGRFKVQTATHIPLRSFGERFFEIHVPADRSDLRPWRAIKLLCHR